MDASSTLIFYIHVSSLRFEYFDKLAKIKVDIYKAQEIMCTTFDVKLLIFKDLTYYVRVFKFYVVLLNPLVFI